MCLNTAYTQQSLVFMTLGKRLSENIVGKEQNTGNENIVFPKMLTTTPKRTSIYLNHFQIPYSQTP